MVKSAAPAAAPSTSTPAVPAVPTNIAAGTAHNPLADLTGARYAGQVNLPNRSMFGADGGVSYIHLYRFFFSSVSLSFPPESVHNGTWLAFAKDIFFWLNVCRNPGALHLSERPY